MKDAVEYFRCSCESPDHAFTIEYFDFEDDDPPDTAAYLYVLVDEPRGFFTRLVRGMKYILNIDTGRCVTTEIILDKEDQKRLAEVLNKRIT